MLKKLLATIFIVILIVNAVLQYNSIYIDSQNKLYRNKIATASVIERLMYFTNDIVENYEKTIGLIKTQMVKYTTDKLYGYKEITKLGRQIEDFIGMDLSSYKEYNAIYIDDDGYLLSIRPKIDVSDCYNGLNKLGEFCKKKNIPIVYVQAPCDVCRIEDKKISGVIDFTNENADDMINNINKDNISVIDMRTVFHNMKLNHHSLFYKTDHHWKIETGLLATKIICDFANKEFSLNLDTRFLDSSMFNSVIYENWSIGAEGRQVSTAIAKPEDFVLLYPKFNTKFNFIVPQLNINTVGDFSVTYDMDVIKTKDIEKAYPYRTFDHDDHPEIIIKNLLNTNNNKVLIMGDSFTNVIEPFMAIAAKEMRQVDTRFYTDSIQQYIEEYKPEIIFVIATPTSLFTWDIGEHRGLFDFD